ncbi:MAG: class I poly(R)-hydroxyalkanoic acid synthase [Pseudomonadota bacterium]
MVAKENIQSEVCPSTDEWEKKWQPLVDKITEQSQRIYTNYLSNENTYTDANRHLLQLGNDLQTVAWTFIADPLKLVEAQAQYFNQVWQFWTEATQAFMDPSYYEQNKNLTFDKRFKDEAWQENKWFQIIKDGYLVYSDFIFNVLHDLENVDKRTAERIRFYTRQYISAMSPTNFGFTNPVVIQKTMESQGFNLLKGMSHMLDDIEKGRGKLNITMTDLSAFKPGDNIASTQGAVVFENTLFQLIQYHPTTKKIYQKPLLIIPPWINKFYILDLREQNSLVKWLTDQGHTVFIISWINPTKEHHAINFEDYVTQGAVEALNAIELATGANEINVAGYCIGGTLLSMTIAYLRALNDKRIVKTTYFATLMDFSAPGDLGVFVTEDQIQMLEAESQKTGVFSGENMAMSFNLLRENDLIWSYYVNNYLLGKEPVPFDLLYWNSDSTNMPSKMHSFYLRNMYLENNLIQPNKITVKGVPIDITANDTPSYFVSTEQDHIALWEATYQGALLQKGDVRFVLGGSGHIAGIINPSHSKKYGYRTNENLPPSHQEWLATSQSHEGSWWSDWHTWLTSGEEQNTQAREPGKGKLPVIESAPGRYVLKKIETA